MSELEEVWEAELDEARQPTPSCQTQGCQAWTLLPEAQRLEAENKRLREGFDFFSSFAEGMAHDGNPRHQDRFEECPFDPCVILRKQRSKAHGEDQTQGEDA